MSFLKKISPEARQYLEKLLREDRYTIDDLFEMFGHEYPNEAPARSTIGRTKKNKITRRFRP